MKILHTVVLVALSLMSSVPLSPVPQGIEDSMLNATKIAVYKFSYFYALFAYLKYSILLASFLNNKIETVSTKCIIC